MGIIVSMIVTAAIPKSEWAECLVLPAPVQAKTPRPLMSHHFVCTCVCAALAIQNKQQASGINAAGGLAHRLIPAAVLAASCAAGSTASMPAGMLLVWGWRIPFLIAAITALAGYVLRYNMPEVIANHSSQSLGPKPCLPGPTTCCWG